MSQSANDAHRASDFRSTTIPGRANPLVSTNSLSTHLGAALTQLNSRDVGYATAFVELLLKAAHELRVSDVHLLPTPGGLDVRMRLDGALQQIGVFPRGEAADVVTRLKVLAELLTYQ